MRELQQRYKDKERRFITFLRDSGENVFDVTGSDYDLKKGIDIYLDGKPFDLKVSNSYKLSLFRKSALYDNEFRCPILIHPEIPYLYVIEKEDRYIGFCINKTDLLKVSFLSGTSFSEFTGDGNLNICIDLKGQISDVAYDIKVWNK